MMYSFCRPISAMSLLKSPHRMCIWFGWLVVWFVMFVVILV